MIEQILDLADKGLAVFPVRSTGNRAPHIRDWYNTATTDHNQLKKWWKRWPDARVGLPTGERNGVWVIDIDVKNGKDGEATLKELKPLPDTLEQVTQSGGRHLFFKWNDSYNIPSRTNVLGEGVDVRCNGGFVVIAPSKGYEMLGGFDLDMVEEAPQWAIDMASKKLLSKSSSNKDDVHLDEEELKEHLFNCPITCYQSRGKWLDVIFAVKAATRGEEYGLELLIEWSKQDADHFDDDVVDECTKAWNSASYGQPGQITGAHLLAESRDNTRFKRAEEAFDDEDIELVKEEEYDKEQWVFQDKTKKLTASDKNAYSLIMQPSVKIKSNKAAMPNPFHLMVGRDDLKQATVFTKAPFWMPKATKHKMVGQAVDDNTMHNMMVQVEHVLGLSYSKNKFFDAMNAVASNRTFHPVVDYLQSLKWDGVPRLDTWIDDYLGVKQELQGTLYLKAISRNSLISAVARAYEPGCEVQNMLVLESRAQGVGKSTAVRIIGGKWFGCPDFDIGSKDAEQNLQGLWVCEWGEMATLSKKDIEVVKDFISKEKVNMRRSHGRIAEEIKRRCIFIGTTNILPGQGYLKDATGGRRFWPVEVIGKVDIESDGVSVRMCDNVRFKEDMDQIWAEAHHRYQSKEDWRLTPAEIKEAFEQQDQRREKDDRSEHLIDWLMTGDGRHKKYLTPFEVATQCFDVTADNASKFKTREYSTMLHLIGWEYKNVRIDGRQRRTFCRPHDWEERFDTEDETLD